MMSETKQIESDDQVTSLVNTELEYQLKKENARLKQALNEQCDRERERTAELKIAADISQLLVTQKWSDLTISVTGKNFAVHKAILAARSTIFADLLEENCNEKCLVIRDVPVGVFEILLSFIYTGKVPSLEQQMAEDLLVAAERYRLEQLKSIAEDYLCAVLSLETVARLHLLAGTVNATKLMGKCLEFTNGTASSSHPAQLPPLARLPDLCLIALFQQLPPIDHLSARNVCHRWSELVIVTNRRYTRSLAILLRQTTEKAENQFNRLSHGHNWQLLKLLQKDDGSPLVPMHSLNQWNSLYLRTLDKETVTSIAATFPVIKSLQLAGCLILSTTCCAATTHEPDLIVRLLELWRLQLTTLRLSVFYSSHPPSLMAPSIDRLRDTVSSMSALKHLSLNLWFNNRQPLPHLPSLSQLHELNTNADLPELVDMLHQCDSLPLARINHQGRSFEESIMSKLTSLSEHLRHSIVDIQSSDLHGKLAVCTRYFGSLTSVEHRINLTRMREDFRHLSRMTALVELSLCIRRIPVQEQPPPQLPQLHSVKLLHLDIQYGGSHRILEMINLPSTLPNVQVVQFWLGQFKCTDCRVYSTKNLIKAKHCISHLFASMKRGCNKLRVIRHDLEDRLGTAEAVLAEQENNVTSGPANKRRRISQAGENNEEAQDE